MTDTETPPVSPQTAMVLASMSRDELQAELVRALTRLAAAEAQPRQAPDDQRAALEKLREAFSADRIGLLPRITCGGCRDARGKCCDQHQKSKCSGCQAWITSAHIHLDYVGHGAVTERLLDADLLWNWEPLRFDESTGMPTMEYDGKGNPVRMWIRLTVAGMTRLGVGTCPSAQDDAEKVLIGDALRNAAMRFGVAVELWIKGHAEDDERTAVEADRAPDRGTQESRGRATTARPEPEPDPERVTVEEYRPYVEQVKALSEPARDAFIEAWLAVEADDGGRLLPTREDGDRTLPVFGELKRAQLPLVEALIMKAQRVETTNGDAADVDRPDESEAPADDEVQPEIDWDGEGKRVAEVMAASRSLLAEGNADMIGKKVWDLHHATLNKQLEEAGEPARDGEPIDVRRMRLATIRFEQEAELLAEAKPANEPEGVRPGEEPF